VGTTLDGRDTAGHGFFNRHRPFDDRDDDRSERRQCRDAFGCHAAADGDRGDARFESPARDAESGLAKRGLGVDPALAGDHQIGVC
jgi:hypothetical protein